MCLFSTQTVKNRQLADKAQRSGFSDSLTVKTVLSFSCGKYDGLALFWLIPVDLGGLTR
jgi:hypothetical protein